jgi:SAM-dependent methyltransferase
VPQLDAEGRIRAYHADPGWRREVCAYSGALEQDLAAAKARSDSSTPARLREAAELARLERMARADYKLALHREWLSALAASIEPGRPFHVLDYGCGTSSFSALALDFEEVMCTLAEAREVVLGYLRWRAQRRGDARLRVLTLPVRGARAGGAARLRVDVRAVEGPFDALVLADVLEHTLDPLRVLTHLLARLRPRGIAFVSYPCEIDGDWHTPEAYFQRRACFWLLRACSSQVVGRARRRRAGPLPALALGLARLAEPLVRHASRGFARRVFRERGTAIVAQVREQAGRAISVGELLADV